MSATDRAVLEVRAPGRQLAARLVWALHVVVVAFFLVGWALPWPEALAFTVGLSIATQIGWWSCSDRCVLTVLEERLRGTPAARNVAADDSHRPPHFVADLGARILGRPISYTWADRVVYLVVWGGGSIAALRLVLGGHA